MPASGAAAAIMHSVSLAHARQAQIIYTILVDGTVSAAALPPACGSVGLGG
ncbi:MAG: hypothetical protein ACYCVZ_16900 [Streptosporangiaceae bacterium]